MPPLPPPAPSRGRSRSRNRFQTRVIGVIAAHRRNLRCRRAGQKGQAARRTRAIYKHLLGILIEYLGQLLIGFTRRLPPSEVIVRKRQAEVRLRYLEDGNFPANKFEVLPGFENLYGIITIGGNNLTSSQKNISSSCEEKCKDS